MSPKISLFASSVRIHYWYRLLNSLKNNNVSYEVIFAGPVEKSVYEEIAGDYPEFKYIETGDIKVAQCYEIARRACKGEIIGWISDDCQFPDGALDAIYKKWNEIGDYRSILAVKTIDPECEINDLNQERFFPRNLNTPQMAIIGFMERSFLESLGGLDRRYVIGKWESDIAMRVYGRNGTVYKFEDIAIQIEHTSKDGMFNNDWSGVNQDGETLESSWVVGGYVPHEKPMRMFKRGELICYWPITNREVSYIRFDKFQNYEDADILTKSQGIKGRWV